MAANFRNLKFLYAILFIFSMTQTRVNVHQAEVMATLSCIQEQATGMNPTTSCFRHAVNMQFRPLSPRKDYSVSLVSLPISLVSFVAVIRVVRQRFGGEVLHDDP